MEDKRVLKINPDLFSLSNNTTRKRHTQSTPKEGIRIKDAFKEQKKKEDTLKNRTALLRMLRKNQEDKYNELMNENNHNKSGGNNQSNPNVKNDTNSFNKDFQEAKVYMDNLAKKTENNVVTRPVEYLSDFYQHEQHPHPRPIPPPTIRPPPFNNSNGMEYKQQQNITVRNNAYQPPQLQQQSQPQQLQQPQQPQTVPVLTKNATQIMEDKINDSLMRISEMRQTTEKLNEFKEKQKPKIKKQKKTRKRTYKIGKSKVLPKISVLISNKTIRHNVSTKTQLLKQVPMQDIKKYLMKRGLIKVGSIAPNDVLRKMYESSILICGEVQNHNPDNLLYNFLNDDM